MSFAQRNPYLDYVSVIAQASLTVSPFYAYKVYNYSNLPDLLQYAISHDVYFKAIPTSQCKFSPELHTTDVVEYKNKTLRFFLTSSTYQTIPSLANWASSIKKLPHTKVGHGSGNLVSYNYCIKFDNISTIPPILAHVLNAFNDCFVKAAALEQIPDLPLGCVQKSTVPLNPHISKAPLSASVDAFQDPHDEEDLFEYISLLHLNSSSLIPESMNEELNSFKVMEVKEVVPISATHLHTFTDVHSAILSDLQQDPSVVSIVARGESTWVYYKSDKVIEREFGN